MTNRWIYGVELLVFGWIALRGGLDAVRSRAPLARLAGLLALAAAGLTALVFVGFLLDWRVPPLIHFTPLVGVLLVVIHRTIRVSRVQPGWAAPFVGVYATLALLVPRPRGPSPVGSGKPETTADESGWEDE